MTEVAIVLWPALAVGSFLNVVVARVPERRSLGGRSGCMSCSAPIAWYDNVPIVSYLVLRGRCRRCQVRISPLYPTVEVVTAVLVAASIWHFGPTAYGALAAGFCVVLVALAAIDARHGVVPDRIVLPAAASALVLHTLLDPTPEWAIASLGAAGFFLAAVLVYPSGLGLGDVKFTLLLGAMLGSGVILAVVLGFLLTLLPSLALVARHGKEARKMAIPIVPFLALGAVVTVFFG
jgi:leader peptidase (prepilin peptidase)/N-methyltransferase